MKKLFSAIALLLLASLLFCACAPTASVDSETTEDTASSDTTTIAPEETPRDPDRYEYWLSDVSELAIELDKEGTVAKFYSLQTGYYAYFAVHEGTYTFDGTTLEIAIHDTTYTFTYNESDDTFSIKNSVSDQDDIVYNRVESAPEAHPTYDFPAFEDLDFTGALDLGDYRLNELKQAALEEAGIKIFLDYYSSSVEPYPEVKTRPIQRGDYVNIDYIGYLNGSPIEGAGGTDQFVPVIAHPENIDNVRRVEGFINGLVGHTAGETFEMQVIFPADYPNELVAGKTTVFEVRVNAIYDVALTDEQVKTYEDLAFDNYNDYLVGVAKEIVYETGIPYLVAELDIADLLPTGAYMHFYQFYLDQAHALAKQPPYQMEYEEYLTITGQSEELMLSSAKQMAADFMLAYHIADEKDLEWTSEQYADQYDLMVQEYLDNAVNKDKAEELISTTRMDELYAELTYRIAGEWIANTAFATK